MNYIIKLKSKFLTKTIKNVKGHYFPDDIPKNYMIIVKEDESKLFVNMDKYETIDFSKELYLSILEKVNKEKEGLK